MPMIVGLIYQTPSNLPSALPVICIFAHSANISHIDHWPHNPATFFLVSLTYFLRVPVPLPFFPHVLVLFCGVHIWTLFVMFTVVHCKHFPFSSTEILHKSEIIHYWKLVSHMPVASKSKLLQCSLVISKFCLNNQKDLNKMAEIPCWPHIYLYCNIVNWAPPERLHNIHCTCTTEPAP